jgi:predicted ATP-binding protein involved in virulence
MRIKQISVIGLFGIFNHVIPLNMDDRITVIHGPNGFGKTAMLTILDGLFNSRYSKLRTIPFSKFRVEFDDDSNIEIIKNVDNSEETENNFVFNFHDNNNFHDSNVDTINFKPKIRPDIENPSLNILDNSIAQSIVPWGLAAAVLKGWYDSSKVKYKSEAEPEWFEKLKKNIYIRLIESQWLLNLFPNRPFNSDDRTPTIESTVSAYSNELAKLMQDKFKEYGTISQSLDRTFPMRVVKQQSSPDITNEQLRNQLKELEETRSRLIEVGLLDQDEYSEFQIQPQDIDESTKNALSVYVEDVEKKLNVFNEIAIKINLLKRIINNKFSYKEINFSKEKGFIFTTLYNSSLSDSKILSPNDLSSGEQHELVLLYELLFKVQPNSLVLIDEPELSLHVGWQIQFLKDLQEITKLANVDILIATHSPDIIQDRWDLTVELKGTGK